MAERNLFSDSGISRRAFLTSTSAATAAAIVSGCGSPYSLPLPTVASPYSDADILNLALNLEYLESEYYLRAATGAGLSAADAGSGAGSVTAPSGPVITGSTLYTDFLNEFAQSELAHVRLLQKTIASLGGTPVVRPVIDLQNSFIALATAAGISGAASFNPYASWNNFLIGVALFEDIGVTAYTGAAPLIQNATALDYAAGIQAKEAYTGGLARTLLAASAAGAGADTSTLMNANLMIAAVNKLAMADGSTAGGAVAINSGVSGGTLSSSVSANSITLTPADSTSLAYGRTPNQILHIAYGQTGQGVFSSGGFFPNGLNGTIKATTT